MPMYTICVGISVYRQRLSWLLKSIDSILNQTFNDWQLIIRLDGPDALDDADKEILIEYVKNSALNQRINIIDGSIRCGCFGSCRELFDESDSDYLCQVDADDFLAPTALEDCLACLRSHPSASFVYSYCGLMSDDNQIIGLDQRALNNWSFDLELTKFITYHFRLVRSEFYFNVGGYDSDFRYAGDYDLCLRLSEVSHPVLIDKILYLYRVHSSSASQVNQSATHLESLRAARNALMRRGLNNSYLLDSSAHESVQKIDQFNGPILVAGLHRSGTSLLCRILSSLGVDFPGPLLASDQDNPTGYYEHADLVALHREWFSQLPDDEWNDWGLSKLQPLSSLGCFEWRTQALSFFEKLLLDQANSSDPDPAPFWALKDPRATLMLPFWRESCAQKMLLMAVYRRPWDASDALMRIENSLFRERPELILTSWFTYNKSLLDYIKAFPHQSFLAASDRLVDQTSQLIDLVNERWGLRLSIPEVAENLFTANKLNGLPYSGFLDRLYSCAFPHVRQLFVELDQIADLPTGTMDVGSYSSLNQAGLADSPLVSIVIPTWNPRHLLLESIASAEYAVGAISAELIIVDDGSESPESLRILNSLRDAGYRIVSQKHSGLSQARNLGFSCSKAEFVIPLDDDNRLLSPYLSEGISLLQGNLSMGWIYGDQLNFGAQSSVYRPGEFDLGRLRNKNYIDACCLMRKSMWHSIGGYDASMPALEDWEFWLNAGSHGWVGQYLPMPCFEYRVRENSLLRRHLADNDQHRDVIASLREKYGPEIMSLNE